jgi:amino acid permease
MVVIRIKLVQGVVIERPCEPWLADVVTVVSAVAITSLSLPMEIGHLAHSAEVSVAAFCFLVITLIYFGASEVVWAGTNHNGTNATNTSVVWWPTDERDELSALGSAFPVILFAFGCQFQLIDIYRGVEASRLQSEHATSLGVSRGSSHFFPVVLAACSSMLVLFALTGVFGVLAFPGQDIAGDILTMLASKGVLGNVARGLLIVACILAAPLLVHCARSCISTIVVHFFGTQQPVLRNRLMTVAVVLLALLIALSGVDFLVGVSAMGAFLCPPLFYLLPGGALLRLVWLTRHRSAAGLADSGDSALLSSMSDEGSRRHDDRLTTTSAISMGLLAVSLIVTGAGTAVVSVWVFMVSVLAAGPPQTNTTSTSVVW